MARPLQMLAQASKVALAVAATPVIAQDSAPERAGEEAERNVIIVTANKREQSANDVGLTIAAASAVDLEVR